MRRRQGAFNPNVWNATSRGKEVWRESRSGTVARIAVQSWAGLILSLLSAFLLLLARSASSSSYYKRPKLHIFTAPKPFIGRDNVAQRRALESWLSLAPTPKITLLTSSSIGAPHEFDAVLSRYSSSRYDISVRKVDGTFLGVPLFSSVISSANATIAGANPDDDVVVFLNADIILFDDFSKALSKLKRKFFTRRWIALGGRWDVPDIPQRTFSTPFLPSKSYKKRLKKFVRSTGTLHTYGGIDLWAWPYGKLPPISGTIPPFILGRGRYDNWFTSELLSSIDNNINMNTANAKAKSTVSIVDISEAVTLAHVQHDHHLVKATTNNTASMGEKGDGVYWMADPKARFELYINAHLASTNGYFIAQQGTLLHAPYKLVQCAERGRDDSCLFRRRRPHTCRCEHAPFVNAAMSDPYVIEGSRIILCGLRSNDIVEGLTPREISKRWQISSWSPPSHGQNTDSTSTMGTFGLPLTFAQLLGVIQERISDSTVLLVVVSEGEAALAANTICSARKVGTFNRLVLATMDESVYKYGMLLGWPVYFVPGEDLNQNSNEDVRSRRRLSISRSLLLSGVSVVSVAPGGILRRNITRYLGHNLEFGTDIAVTTMRTGGDGTDSNTNLGVTTDFMFIRGTRRSAKLLDTILGNTEEKVEKLIPTLACGTETSFSAAVSCRNERIRMQFLGENHIAYVRKQKAGRSSISAEENDTGIGTAVLLPDDRETTWGRLDIISRRKEMALFNERTKLCIQQVQAN